MKERDRVAGKALRDGEEEQTPGFFPERKRKKSVAHILAFKCTTFCLVSPGALMGPF
jgi:hypothetical protein